MIYVYHLSSQFYGYCMPLGLRSSDPEAWQPEDLRSPCCLACAESSRSHGLGDLRMAGMPQMCQWLRLFQKPLDIGYLDLLRLWYLGILLFDISMLNLQLSYFLLVGEDFCIPRFTNQLYNWICWYVHATIGFSYWIFPMSEISSFPVVSTSFL